MLLRSLALAALLVLTVPLAPLGALAQDTVDVARLAGDGRVATAVAVSQHAFPDGADAVVVAAAGSFPDALAAAPLAAQLGGPLLLADQRAGGAVLDEIDRLGAATAVVVGAVGAVPLVVQDELARAGLAVRRIAGDGRFDTAALVAIEVGTASGATTAVVASGGDFADALAVAPVAAAEGLPILLTGSDALPEDTAAALTALGITATIVVGGTAAVSDSVLDDLPDPTRIAGDDRYETAAEIARFGLARGRTIAQVFVATGATFPDALAAGPAAAATGDGAVLLLVDGTGGRRAGPADDVLAEQAGAVEQLLVLGGVQAVETTVADRLAAAAGEPAP